MKRALTKVVMKRLASSIAIGLLTVGVIGSQQALAATGITNTKHNLTSTGTGTNKFTATAGGGEICVFCHTPHGAATSAAVPLWNRVLSAPTDYQTYNSLGTSSLDGITAPVGSVSLACLSCHDGSQAMNVMINAPGSGNYNATTGFNQPGTWVGSDKITGVNNIALIGTDLRNDHPVGIQYGGGPVSSIPAAGTVYTSADMNDKDFNPAQSKSINSKSGWWVETGTAGTGRQKSDMQLYTRTGATGVGTGGATMAGDQPFVECASCHDPHTDTQATFLRISNDASKVCLACHIK